MTKEINIGDIVVATKGTSLRYYLVTEIIENYIKCQEVDKEFNIIKQPRGHKYRKIRLSDCFLHSKKDKDKYIKVL